MVIYATDHEKELIAKALLLYADQVGPGGRADQAEALALEVRKDLLPAKGVTL